MRIGGKSQFTKYLKSTVTDQCLKFKELDLLVDKSTKNLHRNMLFPFVSLMGVENETEPAVEVTDPAEPAVCQDARMMSLVRANKFMDTYFDPDW